MNKKPEDQYMNPATSKDAVPSFIKKTYEMLDEKKHADIVSWSEDGSAIIIKDCTEFSRRILPAYFKHNKLTSFVRQLNMYNFHKKKTLNSYQVYYHELFQRGKKNLLHKIKRKTAEHSLEKSVHELEILQATRYDNDINQENLILKKLNKEAVAKMYCLETKFKELTDQNQFLWGEIYKKEKRQEFFNSMLKNYMEHEEQSKTRFMHDPNPSMPGQEGKNPEQNHQSIGMQGKSMGNPLARLGPPGSNILLTTSTLNKDPKERGEDLVSKDNDMKYFGINSEESYFDQESIFGKRKSENDANYDLDLQHDAKKTPDSTEPHTPTMMENNLMVAERTYGETQFN
jgi:heat shock transcription factor 1